MEITTIIGIVIAIVIMLFGIRLILKNLRRLYRHWMRICILILTARPVIPRHVRSQLSKTESPAAARGTESE